MKKEILACLLLLIILALSIINTHHLEMLTSEITELVMQSKDFAAHEDWVNSEKTALEAITLWRENSHYTHIVLRHTDIDAMTDNFFELMEHIYSQDPGGVEGSAGLVSAHLANMADMERIRLGSIF